MIIRIGRVGLVVLWIAVFAYAFVMMRNHFMHISTPDQPTDEEIAILGDIKHTFPSLSHASFTTNLHDDEASQGAYYQTQFGWCPFVLSDDVSLHDTIIAYKSTAIKDSDIAILQHCDTLYRKGASGYSLFVLHKIKQ
jgi:hypothetical protein